jgi:hypothetical protein
MLAQAEFAYNNSVNRSTGFTPINFFQARAPKGVIDLLELLITERRSADAENFTERVHVAWTGEGKIAGQQSNYKESC